MGEWLRSMAYAGLPASIVEDFLDNEGTTADPLFRSIWSRLGFDSITVQSLWSHSDIFWRMLWSFFASFWDTFGLILNDLSCSGR